MQSVPLVPSDPPAPQGQASKPATSSPPEGFNEVVLNKGSSTAVTPVGTIEALDQQETSPPSKEVPLAGEPNVVLETPVIEIPSDSSPRRVHVANQSEEESEAYIVSHYFAEGEEDEVMQEEVEVLVLA